MKTTDNNYSKELDISEYDLDAKQNLQILSNVRISELNNVYPNVLIYPSEFSEDYKDQLIYSIIGKKELRTYNIAGFIQINKTKLQITSRFEQSNNDNILYYMLSKVLDVNILDWKFGIKETNIIDLLYCLFPNYLKKALNQGIYKQYKKIKRNDANIHGVIDIARHIKINNPFIGNVAYTTREYSSDNSLTQLIRHTIEKIRNNSFWSSILRNDDETAHNVLHIIQVTPSFNQRDLLKVIEENRKQVSHPYFSEYIHLQQLCLQILNDEKISYDDTAENEEVHGILFDIAILWEEYLNKIFLEQGLNHSHSDNRKKLYGQNLFKNNKGLIYPDFVKYSDETKQQAEFVIDAKYKFNPKRHDYLQISAYMFRYNCKGYLIYPRDKDDNKTNTTTLVNRQEGREFDLTEYVFLIPQNCNSYLEFITAISKSEEDLVEQLKTRHKNNQD